MSLVILGSQRMAYMRSLSIQGTVLARRFNPSFTYISQYDDSKKPEDLHSSGSKMETFLAQVRSLRLNPSSTCISPYNECEKSEDQLSNESKVETFLVQTRSQEHPKPSSSYISCYKEWEKTENLHSSGSKIDTFLAHRKPFRSKPSSTHISHHSECKKPDVHSSGSKMMTFLAQRNTLGSFVSQRTFCPIPSYGLFGNGLPLKRAMSTSAGEASEVANVFEVSMAASDSAFPIAAVEHFIDGVHSVTGLNWWASIVVATLLVRGAGVPSNIYYLRKNSTAKDMMIGQQLLGVAKKLESSEMVAKDFAESVKKVRELAKKFRRSSGTSFKDIFFPYSQIGFFTVFSLAISNMAEKVPSFKTGGTLWFTDLSTPDAMYILPISLALTIFLRGESAMFKLKVAPGPGLYVDCLAVFGAFILMPLTMSFSMALFCYWITTNMFSVCFNYVISDPRVAKALGIPGTTSASPSPTSAEDKQRKRDKWNQQRKRIN